MDISRDINEIKIKDPMVRKMLRISIGISDCTKSIITSQSELILLDTSAIFTESKNLSFLRIMLSWMCVLIFRVISDAKLPKKYILIAVITGNNNNKINEPIIKSYVSKTLKSSATFFI
jgi:hypothetical protein